MILTQEKQEFICENISRSSEGELCFAGMPLSPLAKKYGTPLYLYDVDSFIYDSFNGKLTSITYGNGLIEEYVYNDLDMVSEI